MERGKDGEKRRELGERSDGKEREERVKLIGWNETAGKALVPRR